MRYAVLKKILKILAVLVALGGAVAAVAVLSLLALESWFESRNPPVAIADARAEVTLYYYNEAADTDAAGNVLCSRKGLVGVRRGVLYSFTNMNSDLEEAENLIRAAIGFHLLGGPWPEEIAQGATSEFPLEGVQLAEASLSEDGALSLIFEDPQGKTSGGACRVSILRAQIEETALQLSGWGVKTVRILPEELFQP